MPSWSRSSSTSRGFSIYQIAERVQRAGLPGGSAPNIHRDLSKLKSELKKKYTERGFDAVGEVAITATRYEHVIHDCLRDAARTNDFKEKALLRKIAVDTSEKLTLMLERVGLIDQRAFRLPPDEGKALTRIPTREEIFAKYESVLVSKNDLVSPTTTVK